MKAILPTVLLHCFRTLPRGWTTITVTISSTPREFLPFVDFELCTLGISTMILRIPLPIELLNFAFIKISYPSHQQPTLTLPSKGYIL
jgi:hypothetical protein